MDKEKGFSVSILLVLAALVIIGVIGWRVWETAQSKKSPSTQNADHPQPNNQPPSNSSFKSTAYGYSFNYPVDWNLNSELQSNEEIVTLKAPNTLTSEQPIGGYTTDKGAIIRLFVNPCTDNRHCSIDYAYDGIYGRATSRETAVVNNTSAVRFQFAYEGEPAMYTVLFKDNTQYIMTSTAPGEEKSNSLFSVYQDLLSSFKF